MKFMVTWQVHPDKRHEALKGFAEMSAADDDADTGEGVKLIGRWHDLANFTGVAIAEADDASALHSWALNWNGVLDMDIVPVLDDAEARSLGKAKFS